MSRRAVVIGGAGVAAALGGVAAVSFLTTGSAEDYDRAMQALRAPLPSGATRRDLVRFATLAANSHNTQPWRFRLGEGMISVAPDWTRRTPVVDPDDHHLYASLGCAAENLAIAAASAGLPGELQHDRQDGTLAFVHSQGEPLRSPLLDAIPRRQTTRAPFNGAPVSAEDLALLEEAARIEGVNLALLTERRDIDRVRDLVIAGNTAQVEDEAFVRELRDWIRFNPKEALERGDGLPAAANGNPAIPRWFGRTIFDMVFTAEAENAKYLEQMDTSAGVAVFAADRANPSHWVRAGRACQRFALQATALGIKTSFINQPIEVAEFRGELAGIAGFGALRPDIVMRFGYGDPMPMSPRRPVEAVIDV
ncbi:Tat pathway signal protein [Alteraurantiacibacter aquimixticola]|uniref:Tat pathway signal protein n=1 Tax=Alteraurantiacibacter aquimixticola TaxID=2489173 RepID=A0A4T3F1F0_9SPHN|nr:Tat pathway signal protein [Alteraurantiacibacter aquimixticola]